MSGERKSGRVVRPWTEAELVIVDRHVELARGGGWGSARRSVTACMHELAKKFPGAKRTRFAVDAKVALRRRLAGDLRFVPCWTTSELAIVSRYARLLRGKNQRAVPRAVTACTRELAEKFPGGKRTRVAVKARICARRKAKGDDLHPDAWVEAERSVLNRFVRAYAEGRYVRMSAAAADCRAELDRLRLSRGDKTPRLVQRSEALIARRLYLLRMKLGIPKWTRGWTDAELRTVNRYARAVAEGRYESCRAATMDCKTALDRQRKAGSVADRQQPTRSPRGVLTRLAEEARPFRPVRRIVHWTGAELKIVDRYAQRLLKGSLKTMLDAVLKCEAELARKTGPGAPGDEPGVLRTELATGFCLYRRLHRAAYLGKGAAAWSPEERAIRDRVVRAWKRSRAKGQPWQRKEAALRLRQRLRARGFKRTSAACWAMAQDGTRPYSLRT